jgi:hypothetical protein
MPIEMKEPVVGPNFTIFVPAELVFQLKGNGVEFDIKGGGFFFYGFDNKINYGNLDRALREAEGWSVANSSVNFKNNPGFGYHAGVEFLFEVTRQFSISLEGNYLIGAAKFPLYGSYTGGITSLETKPINYEDAKIDFTGFEISIGVIFSGR